MNSGRQNWIDVVKGIGIILVVIGHCERPDILLKYIQSFHMPLFFIVAGMVFSNKREFKQFVRRKADGLIRPYFKYAAFNYIIWMLYLAVKEGMDRELAENGARYIVGILYSRGTWYWMPNCSPIWFLTAMFMAVLLFYSVLRCKEPIQYCLVGLAFGLACFICRSDIIKMPWNFDTALWGLLYMMFGYKLKQFGFAIKVNRNKAIWTLSAIILFGAGSAAAFRNNVDYVSMDSMIKGNVILMLISTLCIPAAIMIIVAIYITENKVFELYGRNTLIILGLNYMVNKIVYIVWDILPEAASFDGKWMIQGVIQVLLLGLLAYASDVHKTNRSQINSIQS